MIPSIPTSAKEWRSFVKDHYTVPQIEENAPETTLEFRKRTTLYDLIELADKVAKRSRLCVYTDVLVMSQPEVELSFTPSAGLLTVVAREVCLEQDSRITIHFRAKFTLRFHFGNINYSLSVSVPGLGEVKKILPGDSNPVVVTCEQDGRINVQDRAVISVGKLNEREFMEFRFVEMELRIASLVQFSHPDLARSICQFLQRLMKACPDSDNYKASSEILTYIETTVQDRKSGIHRLSALPFRTIVQTGLSEIDRVSPTLVKEEAALQKQMDKIEEEAAAISNPTWDFAELEYACKQSDRTFRETSQTYRDATNNFTYTEQRFRRLSLDLVEEIIEWFKDEKTKLKIRMALSVIALTWTVVHAVAGTNPAGLLSLPDICQSFSELGEEASEIWDKMDEVMNTKQDYADLIKTSRGIEEALLGTANLPVQLSLLEREHKDAIVIYSKRIVCRDTNAVIALANWEKWFNKATTAISDEVPKTDSFNMYKKALSDLKIDGMAISQAAIHAVNAYDSHREACERLQRYKQAQSKRRADLENDYNPRQLAAFDLNLHEKTAIYKRVREMESAYMYGTSEVPELILDPGRHINDIRTDVDALSISFERQMVFKCPQPRTVPDVGYYHITTPSKLKDLDRRRFSFTTDLLSPTNNPFANRCCVRVTRVHITFPGAQQSLRFKEECPNNLLTVRLRLHYTGEFDVCDDFSTTYRYVTGPFSDYIEFNLDCHGNIGEDVPPTYVSDMFRPAVGPFDVEVLTPQDQLDLTGVTSVGFKWYIMEYTRSAV